MIFGKKRDWEDQYDEEYVNRSDRREQTTGKSTVWIHTVAFAVTAIMLLAAVGLVSGQTMFEKTLTALASPIGGVWLLLIAIVYFGFLFRQTFSALLALGCWILLTVFGNSFVANQMVYSLERQHLDFNVAELEKLDVVFVLGGGTTTTLQGNEQIGRAGDRIVAAARLYHRDKVSLIVCTGRSGWRQNEQELHPHEEAARLLVALDVPATAIAKIGGKNTADEMQLAAKFLDQQQLSGKKVGIITSAWHLNRAQRLANKYELNPLMIPSDFRSQFFKTGPDLLIPSASNLEISGACVKEFLAGLIGR